MNTLSDERRAEIQTIANNLALDASRRDPSWTLKVNVDTLDMLSTDHCLVAQLHGGYDGTNAFLRSLGPDENPIKLGYYLLGTPADYEYLTYLVKEYVLDDLVVRSHHTAPPPAA